MSLNLTDYVLIADTAGVNEDTDDALLMENGVAAIIRRMNESDGSLVLDDDFVRRWDASPFKDKQAAYLVTNQSKETPRPTDDKAGTIALSWVRKTLPSNCRVFATDTEIDYEGNPTRNRTFCNTILGGIQSDGLHVMQYSGANSFKLVKPWIVDISQWWARYMNVLSPRDSTGKQIHMSISWDELRAKIATLTWSDVVIDWVAAQCPNLLKYVVCWQVASAFILPGSNGNPIDISIMTRAAFDRMFGALPIPQPEYVTTDQLESRVAPIEAKMQLLSEGVTDFISLRRDIARLFE